MSTHRSSSKQSRSSSSSSKILTPQLRKKLKSIANRKVSKQSKASINAIMKQLQTILKNVRTKAKKLAKSLGSRTRH